MIRRTPPSLRVGRYFLKGLPTFLWIIIITSAISLIGLIIFNFFPGTADYFVLSPEKILQGEALWTLVTHVFFHADFLHLFVNMFSLLFIGSVCETIIGKKRFIGFYLVAGITGGVFFILSAYFGSVTGYTNVFGNLALAGVGASGALFGLLGILAVIIPKKKVYLIAGPLILIILQVMLPQFISGTLLNIINILISLLLFIMIFSLFVPSSSLRKFSVPIEMPIWFAPIAAIVPLVLITIFGVALPIGNSAHFGGLVAGLIYGAYLRFNYPRKVEMIGRVFR